MSHRPDFIIVGAPKCGTTSLFEYLRTHPGIFMSVPKEPHFFTEDHPAYRKVTTLEDYEALFAEAGEGQCRGEASTSYLHSDVAVGRILETYPDIKLIAMLRNPVDLVHSLHAYRVWRTVEDVEDFATAWELQPERAEGRSLPPVCQATPGKADMLQYGHIGRIGTQVDRLLASAPAEQVMVLLIDDLKNDAVGTYERVLAFLGVESDGRTEFPAANVNKVNRLPGIARWVVHEQPPVVKKVVRGIKKVTGLEQLGVAATVNKWSSKRTSREAMDPDLRAKLVEEFRAEVELLEERLGRELEGWKR